LVAAGLLSAGTVLHAAVSIDWVTVGNANNPADPLTGYGAVDHAYQIGKYEVTNAQYAACLNAVDPGGTNPHGIYNANMGSHLSGGISYNSGAPGGEKYSVRSNMADKPVNYVSWYDAARFANWMHNGQGGGGTENGVYNLNGATSGIFTAQPGATVWLPSENEWYKGAYYDPTPGAGGGDNYWLYATRGNTTPDGGRRRRDGQHIQSGGECSELQCGSALEWFDWQRDDGGKRRCSQCQLLRHL